MGTWEVWLSKTGKACAEPGLFPAASALAATDLAMTRGHILIECFPCARHWTKVLNLDFPI